MAMMKIAGIMRSGAFSPNHIGNDAIIFNMVADQLRKRGCEVAVYTEEQFATAEDIDEPVILSMCREPRNIVRTQRLEDSGRIVINSGYGIENCTRARMTRIFGVASIPFPTTLVVDTDEVVRERIENAGMGACWVKRADIHTRHKEDVTYARHPQEAQEVLQEFFLRGIKKAIISRHAEGNLVKFYGVSDSGFFSWLNPYDAGMQPGSEGSAMLPDFDAEALRTLCTRAAELLDVRVYGGDCVVGPNGELTIVNFNDWPSFAPCRRQAASAIARTVFNIVKNGTAR